MLKISTMRTSKRKELPFESEGRGNNCLEPPSVPPTPSLLFKQIQKVRSQTQINLIRHHFASVLQFKKIV